MRSVSFAICLLIWSTKLVGQVPLPLGHSHNDYEQERPLFHALSLGFTSIEADIHPFFGQLKVAHEKKNLWKKPNLKTLYISPLDSIIQENGGSVFPNDSTVMTLMIDLKTKKEIAVRRLHRLLKRHDHLFYKKENNSLTWGPIRVVLSGNPPNDVLSRLESPYLFVDGRIGEEYPPNVKSMVCRISANFNSMKDTNGNVKSFDELSRIVRSCTKNGRNFRFWSTKDNAESWDYLKNLGVSLIGVDDLDAFATYMRNDVAPTLSSK